MSNHTHTQYTSVFMWKPKAGENHKMIFLMSLRITFIGSTNFLYFPAATGRRLQPPSFSGYNLREAPTPNSLATTRRRLQPPMFFNYNQRWLQPPVLAPSNCPNHRSRMMEPLSHYHYEIYCCKLVPINLHQTTCNNLYQTTYNQPVP
jgi:hypothetical protein